VPAVEPPVTSTAPIRASIDKALIETLAKLPASSRGRLEVTVTNTGARLEVAHRINRVVTATGWAGLAWGQALEFGARLSAGW
jgi:hypothetical protein